MKRHRKPIFIFKCQKHDFSKRTLNPFIKISIFKKIRPKNIFFVRWSNFFGCNSTKSIWLDSIKWSKNCHFWFFRQNDENPNFWLWIVKAQKRKGFISYQYYFFHIQSICYNMTYMVFVRFDLREVLMWAHFTHKSWENKALFKTLIDPSFGIF